MRALDEILEAYFGVPRAEVFDEQGELTEKGAGAYQRLTELVYDLEDIGVLFDAAKVVERLDEITNSDIY